MGNAIDRYEECAKNKAAWSQEVRKRTKRREGGCIKPSRSREETTKNNKEHQVMAHSISLDARETKSPEWGSTAILSVA